MSFAQHKTIIQENDTVILYMTVNNFHAIDVVPQTRNKKGELVENVFQTSFGALKVKNLIGEKYGSKVRWIEKRSVKLYIYIYHIILTNSNYRWIYPKAGHLFCSQHRNYGHKHCRIGRKSSTHRTSAWYCSNWKSNRAALLSSLVRIWSHFCGWFKIHILPSLVHMFPGQAPAADLYPIHSCVRFGPVVICTRLIFISSDANRPKRNSSTMASLKMWQWVQMTWNYLWVRII